MSNTKKILAAQVLAPWVSQENHLSPTEAAGEAMTHEILVAINRPAPSPLALALVSVLASNASPCTHGGTSK